MALKATTALFALAALLLGTVASPVPAEGDPADADTFYVWSDTSRCDPTNPLEIKIRDYSSKDAKGNVLPKPDIVGEQLSSGEIQFKLKAPFEGNYVVSPKKGQTYAPPEVKIELFEKGKKPAGKATYIPGLIPVEFDTIAWTPDSNVKDQRVLKPSLDHEAQFGQPKQGKEESITTDTYPDALWLIWCSGERERLLETSLRTRLGAAPPTE